MESLEGPVSLSDSVVAAVPGSTGSPARFRAAPRDLLALTKPRITTIVLATSGAGVAMAPGTIAPAKLALSLIGTALVVSAANALNMWWERDVDGKMARTADRPLPAGRMGPDAALLFGIVLGAVSVPMLFAVNAASGCLGLLALVSYVAVYTPLKRVTPLALQIGAVPGAIPPLLGWASVTGGIGTGGLLLFAIMFFWQIPHFVAISLFRADDYARAGLRVYAVVRGPRAAKLTIALSSAFLAVVTILPAVYGMAGRAYLATALGAGALFIALSLKGLWLQQPDATSRWARRVFGYSILYLLVVLGALLANHTASLS